MSINDILADLKTGLAEDEKRAKAELRVRDMDREAWGIVMADIRIPGILRHAGDPRRVLRQVDALRKVITDLEGLRYGVDRWRHNPELPNEYRMAVVERFTGAMIYNLASIYSGGIVGAD